jgi:hypothetical protein
MKWTSGVLILMSLGSTAYADHSIVYRWGGPADDAALIRHAKTITGGYRLTREDIIDAVNHDLAKGWNKSSGSGIFYSTDPADSFSDGRSELFIFHLEAPAGKSFPIGEGALGNQVRDYYLKNGPEVPMISRYNPTWHVIARVPEDEDFENGLKITFHPATELDAEEAFNDLTKNWGKVESVSKFELVLNRYLSRVIDKNYQIPEKTLKFIQNFAAIAKQNFGESSAIADTDAALNKEIGSRLSKRCILETLKKAF